MRALFVRAFGQALWTPLWKKIQVIDIVESPRLCELLCELRGEHPLIPPYVRAPRRGAHASKNQYRHRSHSGCRHRRPATGLAVGFTPGCLSFRDGACRARPAAHPQCWLQCRSRYQNRTTGRASKRVRQSRRTTMTDTFRLHPRQLQHMREQSAAILAAKPWLAGCYAVPKPTPMPVAAKATEFVPVPGAKPIDVAVAFLAHASVFRDADHCQCWRC
jgi:hypothetical protein